MQADPPSLHFGSLLLANVLAQKAPPPEHLLAALLAPPVGGRECSSMLGDLVVMLIRYYQPTGRKGHVNGWPWIASTTDSTR